MTAGVRIKWSLEGHRTHLLIIVDFKLENCLLGWVQAGPDSF